MKIDYYKLFSKSEIDSFIYGEFSKQSNWLKIFPSIFRMIVYAVNIYFLFYELVYIANI